MTIIRLISQSSRILRPFFINLDNCARNQFHRNASILAVNLGRNDNLAVRDSRKPKICHSIEGQFVRRKFKKSKQQDDDEDNFDSEMDAEDKYGTDKHSKVMKVTINSLRADLIVKSGLGIARNKVEALFYESKIRVNGQKIDKKSARVEVGDEIDVIKGVSQMNPDHLVVQRVEILSVRPKDDDDGLVVNLRRNKSLIIDNYEDAYEGKKEEH